MDLRGKIQVRQNNLDMLRCQYAARFYFNKAEKENYFFFLVSIFSALCFFLPDKIEAIILIPILLDLMTLLLRHFVRLNVKKGALLRNYFDYEVLGAGSNVYSINQKEEINERIFNIVKKNSTKYKKQILNTVDDKPPGVRNWYDVDKLQSSINPVFECQKQNWWWNKRQTRGRLIFSLVFFSLLIIIIILCSKFLNVGLLKMLACEFAFLIFFITIIYENIQYIKLSIKISGIIEILDQTSATKEQISKLQDLINQRRTIVVLEMNWLHSLRSKEWSTEYAHRLSEHNDDKQL